MDELSKIEKKRNLLLPDVYRRFYECCSFAIPESLLGIDLINNHDDLNEGAFKLLEADGIHDLLDSDDFVFMMHQGYIFWYFKANGDIDPIVYGYYEGKLKPDNLGHLSAFVKEYGC